MKSKELREKLAKLVVDQRAALDTAGGITAEIRTQVDAREADITAVTAEIELHERQEARERELATTRNAPIVGGAANEVEQRTAEISKEAREYSEAFVAYLRSGTEDLTPEQRKALKRGYRNEKGEARAQSVGTGSTGGFTVPQGFMAELEKALKLYGGVRQISRELKTQGGNPIPWPTIDDTGNTGEDVAENGPMNEQDLTFGSKTLNAYKMGSGNLLVPTELFEDTGLNLEAEIGDLLGERLGRRQNTKQTLGAGTGTFQGVVVAATAGPTTASPTAITADELIALQHSVEPAYRASKKCAFMMNDDTVRAIRQLKDTNGRYILDVSTVPGEFSKLLGYPVVINQDMATIAASARTVLFGDFNKFVIRDVRSIVIRRLNELFAGNDQVGFVAWYRGDSRLVSASANALKALVQHV